MSTIRVLVVDDSAAWRSVVEGILRTAPQCVINEACDGIEAVHKSAELQPDVILLDIALPYLNGFAAARQIVALAPDSKILFLSELASTGIIGEALRLGAFGCIQKSDAALDLLTAVEAANKGETFVSSSFCYLAGQPS